MNIAIVDCETTGLDPESGSIVELAVVTYPSMRCYHTLVKPEHPIEIQAMAVHHITQRMIAEATPNIQEATKRTFLDIADVIVAHNAGFDKGFLRIDKPWVCTWRCARTIWPDAPGHSNQILRYWLPDLDDEVRRSEIMNLPPHRAAPDAWVTAHIFRRMMELHSIEELIEMTTRPILIKTVNFGKHRGELWSEVPKRYLRWLIAQDFDSDTIHTAKHHLNDVNEEVKADAGTPQAAEPPLP